MPPKILEQHKDHQYFCKRYITLMLPKPKIAEMLEHIHKPLQHQRFTPTIHLCVYKPNERISNKNALLSLLFKHVPSNDFFLENKHMNTLFNLFGGHTGSMQTKNQCIQVGQLTDGRKPWFRTMHSRKDIVYCLKNEKIIENLASCETESPAILLSEIKWK